MYNGVTSEIIPILAWTNVVNRGNGWKKQGDWAVTSYEMCEREFRYRLKKMTNEEAMIKIQFRCIVSGTPPNCADPYVNVQLLRKL